jgi:protein-tyrosine phosphatase
MTDYSAFGLRIPLEGTINTRDLGGYPTRDGSSVKYGRAIRTDNLSHITEKDAAYLSNVLHAHYIVDFRGENELPGREDKPVSGAEYVFCPVEEALEKKYTPHPHEEFIIDKPNIASLVNYIYLISPDGDVTYAMENSYRGFVGEEWGKRHYRIFFDLLLRNETGSLLFHCADGKDRAGVGAALFLSALGVPRDAVLYDYLKTNDYTDEKAKNREKYLREECHITNEKAIRSVMMLAGTRRNWIEAAFFEMERQYGSVESYLKEGLGLSDPDLAKLRKEYTERK